MTSTDIRDMLLDPHSHCGECDQCHAEPVPLWFDHGSDGCGDWLICGPCWRKIAAKQSAPRPQQPVAWHRQKQLLTGLDCLPSQSNLFSTDGSR